MILLHRWRKTRVRNVKKSNLDVMETRRGGDGHVEEWNTWQRRLLEIDRRTQLLQSRNKEHQSTNLRKEEEIPSSKTYWKNRDTIVEPRCLVEPKFLTQPEKVTEPKQSIELGKPNLPITVSKQSLQPSYLSHQLIVQPKLLLVHRLIVPKNYFIDNCYEVLGFWGAHKLFGEITGSIGPCKIEYTKVYVVWHDVWGRRPLKPPNYTKIYSDLRLL